MSEFSNRSILVTGAAGFIGSHLCDSLLAAGATVAGLDNFDPFYSPDEKRANLAACFSHSHFELVTGDIRDPALVEKVMVDRRVSSVVHLAARAGVRPSLSDPMRYADTNVHGTMSLLEAARKSGIRNFVFASSSSVYGNQSRVPFAENEHTDRPLSPYGATKKAGEVLCHTFHHLYGQSVACLRFFTVFGPRQRPDLAIRKFTAAVLRGEPISIYGDGSSRRDYTHIEDIVRGITGAIRWCESERPRYGIFNLGSAHPVGLLELIELIEQFTEKKAVRNYLPPMPGDVFQTYADTSLAEQELGFRHDVEFDTGLRDFVAWMRARPGERS